MRLGRSRRSGGDPEWWRGETPKPLPVFNNALITGEVSSFNLDMIAKSPAPEHYAGVSFQQASVIGIDLLIDELHFYAHWSEFVGCTFRQKTAPASPGGPAAQGSFGSSPSIYRDCEFIEVRFRNLGRFSTGAAHFENCRFTRSRFNGHFAYESDFVDCTFVGTINGCVFGGSTPPSGPYRQPGRHNVITGNDFTGARLGDNIGWRYGFAFDAQHWPDGYIPTVEPQER